MIIVGASVAGACMAIALGERGHSVLLLDRARFPRHKPCGEGLMPEGVAILDRLGVLDAVLAHGARRFRGLRFRSPEGVWAEAEFPGTAPHPEYGLVLPRRELDHVLFERARETPGVEARDGFRVHSLRMQVDRIEGITGARVRGAGAPVRDPGAQESFAAALTIGADGIHSLFHRACGLNRSLLRRRRFGITGHFTGITDRADHVEVLVQPRGELYVAPGPGDLTLVALLLEARAMRDFRHDLAAAYCAFVRSAPGLRGRTAGAELAPPVSAVGPLGFRIDRCHGPGFVLVGDSAGFLDPISGMGMTVALKSAQAALPIVGRALSSGDVSAAALAPYQQARADAVEDAIRFTRLLLRLARHETLAKRGVRRLHRDRDLFVKLLGLVTGTTRYGDVTLSEKLALLRG